jgi:hypothetical protein
MMGVVDSRHLAGQVEVSFDRNRDHGTTVLPALICSFF